MWVGSQANDAEKAAAENTAAAYIQANKMDPATPVITVKSGAEPEMFHVRQGGMGREGEGGQGSEGGVRGGVGGVSMECV